MLELRPNCECCDRDLPPDAPDALICTFECTFCAPCVDDVIVFTGGIGENSAHVRAGACRDMQWAGIELDEARNADVEGETEISAGDSRVAVWVVPTNEELIVARQAAELVGEEI